MPEVDLYNRWEIIRYIRDLINLSSLLERGFDEELVRFIKQLKQAGWGSDRIKQFIVKACYNTRYEEMRDIFGDRLVPRPFPQAGDWFEYLRNKTRLKK